MLIKVDKIRALLCVTFQGRARTVLMEEGSGMVSENRWFLAWVASATWKESKNRTRGEGEEEYMYHCK